MRIFITIVLPTLLAVATIVITVYIWIAQRENRSLQVTVFANSPILSLREPFSPTITVSVGGREVKELYQVAMRLENNGNIPIRKSDYEEPILLRFGDVNILSVGIEKKIPPDISISAEIVLSSTVELTPALLNPGDQVQFTALVEGGRPGLPHASGRVTGVSEIKVVDLAPTSA